MAVIRLKRGTTKPTTSNLTYTGELAFNYSTNELYARNSTEVVKIGGEMEMVYYYEGATSFHSFQYSFNRDYIYKVHVIASTRTSTADSTSTIINYQLSTTLYNGSYVYSMINDANGTMISSGKNTNMFIINDSYSGTVTPSYAVTKVIDFEISPTFESGVTNTYQWVSYGTSVCSVSDQSNAPLTYTHFAHSIDGSLGGLTINPGLDSGSTSPFAVTVYRIKRK
jgi:hypothetical protein